MIQALRDDDLDCLRLRARKLYGDRWRLWYEVSPAGEVVYCGYPTPPLKKSNRGTSKPQPVKSR